MYEMNRSAMCSFTQGNHHKTNNTNSRACNGFQIPILKTWAEAHVLAAGKSGAVEFGLMTELSAGFIAVFKQIFAICQTK